MHQLAKALGVSLASLLQFEAKEPLGAGELRHQLCDIIYETEDPKVLMGMLKAIRKAKGGR
ncbi:hypothetical protein D3C72_2506120 [compost metagenome]